MILKKRFWGAFLCLELADGKKTHGRLLCEGQGWVLLANRNGKTLYRLRDLKACRVEAEEAESAPAQMDRRPFGNRPPEAGEAPVALLVRGEWVRGQWIICWGPWSA